MPRIDRISGAKIATKISRTMNVSAPSATLSLRNRRQNSCSGDRAATGAFPATICVDAVVIGVQQIAGARSSTQIVSPLGVVSLPKFPEPTDNLHLAR